MQPGKPLIDWVWIVEHLDDIGERLLQHLQLTIIPLAIGFVISLLLAIWAVRQPRAYGPVTAVTGILYTIPSLAAFALLRPITGLSLLTAIIPLTTYTLLIFVRNIVAGFNAVPSDVLEAAEGMGYTRSQRLRPGRAPAGDPADARGSPPGQRHDDRSGHGGVGPR